MCLNKENLVHVEFLVLHVRSHHKDLSTSNLISVDYLINISLKLHLYVL